MSRGRGRTWRPRRQVAGKDSRKRVIILLTCLLAGLVSILLLPFIRHEPRLRVALAFPAGNQVPAQLFAADVYSATAAGGADLLAMFEELGELNGDRVPDPVTITESSAFSTLAESGEKVLLYCGLEPVVDFDVDANEAVVKLANGSKSDGLSFRDMLKRLKGVRASQIVLLLDPIQRDTGIANGRLSDDAWRLMAADVQAAGISDLIVMTACAVGERSLEWIQRTAPDAAQPEGDDAAVQAPDVALHGTIFANSIAQAFIQQQTNTVQEFFDFVQQDVLVAAEQQFAETQTVSLLTSNPAIMSNELLVRFTAPASAATAGDSEGDELSVTDKTSNATTDDEQDATKELSQQEQDEADLAALFARRAELSAGGGSRGVNAAAWTDLTASLAAARWALLHRDEGRWRTAYSQANQVITRIESTLSSLVPASRDSFAPWLSQSTGTASTLSADVVATFDRAFRDLTDEETRGLLPLEIRQDAGLRQDFATWISQQVIALPDRIRGMDAASQQVEVEKIRSFMVELPRAGWAKTDWPEPLFTIDETFNSAAVQSPLQATTIIAELMELRHLALAAATGRDANGNRFRRSAFADENGTPLAALVDLRQLLTTLTATERWLVLGAPGLKMSTTLAAQARSEWSDINRSISARQELAQLPDIQQTDLPYMIQFLAQQQEQETVNDNELDAAVKVAQSIIAGAAPSVELFPLGILGRTGLSSEDVKSMFRLTRDFTKDTVDQYDLTHLARLQSFVQTRVESAAGGDEARRLLLRPIWTGTAADQISGLMATQNNDRLAGSRTGLWLSFWSLRLLDALTHKNHVPLWRDWISVIEAVRSDDEPQRIYTRTKLASAITAAWTQLYSARPPEASAQLFLAKQESADLLAHDLQQRSSAGSRNQNIYRQIRASERIGGSPVSLSAVELRVPTNPEPAFDEDNRTRVRIDAGGHAVYVSQSNIRLLNANARRMEDWDRLEAAEELLFSSTNPITEPETILLCAVNASGIVVSSTPLTVHPNANAEWKLVVEPYGTGYNLLQGGTFKLPPSTLNKEQKDVAVPIAIKLLRKSGVAKTAEVTIFARDSSGEESNLGTRTVEFGDSDVGQLVPLAAAPVADGAPALDSASTSSASDVSGGIRFEIQTSLQGAKPTSIALKPLLAGAEEYVQTPVVRYNNATRRLTINLAPKENVTTPAPGQIAVQLHFSRDLKRLVNNAESSGPSIPNLQKPGAFSIAFVNDLQQAFVASETKELEFGLSVAGIPHAWRWRLQEDGPSPIATYDPVVRADLSIANDKEVQAIGNVGALLDGEFLVGADWRKAKLDIGMHIHGGQFGWDVATEKFSSAYELRLSIARRSSGPEVRTELMKAIELRTRAAEAITVSPAANGAWNFSTDIDVYAKRGLQVEVEHGLGRGRYDLIAQLHPLQGQKEPPAHRQSFTLDDTAPEFSAADIELYGAPHSVQQPLKGRINANDRESGIAEIKVGFSKDQLRTPASLDVFSVEPSSPGFPKLEQTERRQSKDFTLYVQAKNRANLTTLVEKDVRFVVEPKKVMKVEEKPVETGTVVFTYQSSLEYTAVLKGLDFEVPQTGASPIVFENVPVGSYKLSWTTGLSTGNSFEPRDVRVNKGKTTAVKK